MTVPSTNESGRKRYRVILKEKFTTDFHDVEASSAREARAIVRAEVETWRATSFGIIEDTTNRFGDNAGDTIQAGYSMGLPWEEDE